MTKILRVYTNTHRVSAKGLGRSDSWVRFDQFAVDMAPEFLTDFCADYKLHRKEQLGYLHEERENSYDMGNIDGPLDADLHKISKSRESLKAKGPVQITQELHQQVRFELSDVHDCVALLTRIYLADHVWL